MLTKIELQDPQGNLLGLSLQDNSSGFTIQSIDGLDPVKATITSSPFAQIDGSEAQGARRENRNIVMTVGLEPYSGGTTVKALRALLYSYAMPKTMVTLRFFEDDAVDPFVTISGQVESFETALFSKDPEVVISILCFKPSFLDYVTTHLSGTGFDTVSLISDPSTTIVYPGTIETGYILTMNVNRTMTGGFSIVNSRPGSSPTQLDVTQNLVSGDVVEISTKVRDKHALKGTTSILYSVPVGSKWAPLYPGTNYFKVVASGAAVPFTLDFVPEYGGL